MSALSAFTLPDPAAISLAAAVFLITQLTFRCFTPPNPNPTTKEKDRLGRLASPVNLSARRAIGNVVGTYHAVICLTYPSPPTHFCPRPENLPPILFTWNPRTVTCILLILIAAPIRLMTFSELGLNFTFKLATPGKLVTTGLYGWVQHPSYTCNIVVILVNLALFYRRDGVAACWLPKAVVDRESFAMALDLVAWALWGFVFYFLTIRVRDEEAMLKRTFGKEWEDYHARTKQFIPGIY